MCLLAMRYVEFEFEFDALYPQAGSRSSCESTVPLILKCACEWLYFWFLTSVLPRELTRNFWLAPIPRRPDWDKRPTAHQEHPAFHPVLLSHN